MMDRKGVFSWVQCLVRFKGIGRTETRETEKTDFNPTRTHDGWRIDWCPQS